VYGGEEGREGNLTLIMSGREGRGILTRTKTLCGLCTQVRTRGDQWRPTLEADGSLCWPVVLAYPEAGMAQDTIEEFHESATIAQHLDVVRALAPGPQRKLQNRHTRRQQAAAAGRVVGADDASFHTIHAQSSDFCGPYRYRAAQLNVCTHHTSPLFYLLTLSSSGSLQS